MFFVEIIYKNNISNLHHMIFSKVLKIYLLEAELCRSDANIGNILLENEE